MDSIATIAPGTAAVRAPSAPLLVAIAGAGIAAASCTVLVVLTSDHISQPGVHAGLAVWGILGFVLAGVVAWWRRPESRLGPLMVVPGAVWFLSTLSSARSSGSSSHWVGMAALGAVLVAGGGASLLLTRRPRDARHPTQPTP